MESKQQRFIQYAAEFAKANAVHIWLGGSFQKGNATPYSDVDISVLGDVSAVRRLIYGYGKPVFLSHTTNPPGILIVIYEDGVAVDLEIVKTIRFPETEFFHTEEIKSIEYKRDESAFRELVLRDDEPYQISRLFHRSLSKYLSGKRDIGISVANEIAAFLSEEDVQSPMYYKSRIEEMLDAFSTQYTISNEYETILRSMIGRKSEIGV